MRKLIRSVWLLAVMAATPLCWAGALPPGTLAPAFTLPRLEGSGDLSLASYRGKVVYLDFWASWCKPCRDAMPALNKMYRQYKSKGLVVIGVNLDQETDWARKFLNKTGVTYPVVADQRGATPKTFGIQRMPTAFILDRNGRVRYVHAGFRPQDVPGIRKHLVSLLGEGT